jgi:hypothetical protein
LRRRDVMSKIAQRLIDLKQSIREAEDEIKEGKGGIKQLKQQLKAIHDVTTTKEAKAKIRKLIKEHDALEARAKKVEARIEKMLEEV